MDIWSLYEDIKPIGFQEFYLMFDLKSAFKITQLDESDESTSTSRRVELKENTLKDKARKDSRGRSADLASALLPLESFRALSFKVFSFNSTLVISD